MTIRVGIFIFENVEVLDFAGPYEVFTTAARVAKAPLFEVFTIAASDEPVRARAGLLVCPDHALSAHPAIDLLIIPGGVVSAELEKPEIIRWIADCYRMTRITASVCTGAFLLAKAGLLGGGQVTTHWEDIADLRSAFPNLDVQEGVRWIDHGRIVSSAGISAGIDMSLHLVERLANRELAIRTARQLDFDWTENPSPEADTHHV
ncbi:MAG: thiamine biosynthesis protein ThiJ [Hydrocarboniphaga sp.]|uniref:DJ-1/PfpI family protein n=1 Tax=Hydrocarboniphaga sp. TaxID=2033016 RepID=UPI0026096A98|nr:DJ-1/PfpI family protein [Hydrocarboniphaga sp.]MDB5968846.1 thiamine biosynthesis protein ThiJ [Hydrocarboniphaga sp.]